MCRPKIDPESDSKLVGGCKCVYAVVVVASPWHQLHNSKPPWVFWESCLTPLLASGSKHSCTFDFKWGTRSFQHSWPWHRQLHVAEFSCPSSLAGAPAALSPCVVSPENKRRFYLCSARFQPLSGVFQLRVADSRHITVYLGLSQLLWCHYLQQFCVGRMTTMQHER